MLRGFWQPHTISIKSPYNYKLNRGTPIWTQEYGKPYYIDPRKGTPKSGKLQFNPYITAGPQDQGAPAACQEIEGLGSWVQGYFDYPGFRVTGSGIVPQ